MAELVLGTLGIVPLIGVAIKSYRVLDEKLRLFRNAPSSAQRIRKKLRVQNRVFENECRLLLRECSNDETALHTMMTNSDNKNWNETQLDHNAKKFLKGSYNECIDLIREIVDAISRLQDELDALDVNRNDPGKEDTLKGTLRNTKNRAKVALEYENFEAGIKELRITNGDLKCLREQLGQLQQPRSSIVAKRRAVDKGGWTDVGRAAKALHMALISAWSCGRASHVTHFLKLFLDTERTEYEVKMNIAILSYQSTMVSTQMELVHLQVRSQPMIYPQSLLEPSMKPQERPRKIAKVLDDSGELPGESSLKRDLQAPTLTTRVASPDLQCSTDICSKLSVVRDKGNMPAATICLGHIDNYLEKFYRHLFFPPTRICGLGGATAESLIGELTRMDTILSELMSYKLSTVDRLKVARSLVLAVLNFHETPWLGESWRLQDLSFFHQENDINKSLQTLHVDVEVRGKRPTQAHDNNEPQDTPMTASHDVAPELSRLTEEERLAYGIDNITLHCLGVALLQIDRSEKMEPADVLGARKLARTASQLGPKYQEITQKCLRCDFGVGSDLSKASLQVAVYESVIGTLESMISVLDICN